MWLIRYLLGSKMMSFSDYRITPDLHFKESMQINPCKHSFHSHELSVLGYLFWVLKMIYPINLGQPREVRVWLIYQKLGIVTFVCTDELELFITFENWTENPILDKGNWNINWNITHLLHLAEKGHNVSVAECRRLFTGWLLWDWRGRPIRRELAISGFL